MVRGPQDLGPASIQPHPHHKQACVLPTTSSPWTDGLLVGVAGGWVCVQVYVQQLAQPLTRPARQMDEQGTQRALAVSFTQ